MILLKVIAVLIVLIRCCCFGKVNHFLSDRNSELIAEAMKDVVLHSLVKDKWTVEIASFESDKVQCNKISNQLMKKLGHEAAYFSSRLPELRNLSPKDLIFKSIGNKSDVVFVINSIDALNSRSFLMVGQHIGSMSRFLIHINAATSEKTIDWFKNHEYFRFSMTNCLFVVDEGGDEIYLKQVQIYSPMEGHTKELLPTFITINTFTKANASWKTNNFEFAAAFNLHNCELTFTYENNPPETIVKVHDNGTEELVGGIAKEIIEALGTELRFKPSFQSSEAFGQHLHTFPISQNYEVPSERCVTFIFKKHRFVIPPGELFSGWEKLALPFDVPTWILVAITFAAGLLTIQVIYRFPMFVRNFVFGSDVSTPTLNIFIAFYGLGQIVLPGRNFARFLLMLFILWSLIIRTAYQGVMFEFLTGDGRKPEVKSFKELIEQKFILFLDYEFFINGYPFVNELLRR